MKPTASLPDARGSFEGVWEVERKVLVTGESAVDSCAGSLTIEGQTESGRLSGSFMIRPGDGCEEQAGPIDGEVRTGGALVLLVIVPGGSENDFEDLTGCVFLIGGNAFGGSLSGDAIAAASTFLGECGGVQSEVTVRFRGER
ncbi:MAG: hypothetical protein ACE5JR_05525 [Gemmatimonadota bacterium]